MNNNKTNSPSHLPGGHATGSLSFSGHLGGGSRNGARPPPPRRGGAGVPAAAAAAASPSARVRSAALTNAVRLRSYPRSDGDASDGDGGGLPSRSMAASRAAAGLAPPPRPPRGGTGRRGRGRRSPDRRPVPPPPPLKSDGGGAGDSPNGSKQAAREGDAKRGSPGRGGEGSGGGGAPGVEATRRRAMSSAMSWRCVCVWGGGQRGGGSKIHKRSRPNPLTELSLSLCSPPPSTPSPLTSLKNRLELRSSSSTDAAGDAAGVTAPRPRLPPGVGRTRGGDAVGARVCVRVREGKEWACAPRAPNSTRNPPFKSRARPPPARNRLASVAVSPAGDACGSLFTRSRTHSACAQGRGGARVEREENTTRECFFFFFILFFAKARFDVITHTRGKLSGVQLRVSKTLFRGRGSCVLGGRCNVVRGASAECCFLPLSGGGCCCVSLQKEKGAARPPNTHTHTSWCSLRRVGACQKTWGHLFFVAHVLAALPSTARCACATRAAATAGIGTTAPWASQAVVVTRARVGMRPVDSR